MRVIALVVLVLFCILGLRLWALQALQAPAAAKAVAADQIREVAVDPTRGLILDRYGNPLVDNTPTEQITLSRVAAKQDPAVIGRLAALIGETSAQVTSTINDLRYSPYKPVPILSDAPAARRALHPGAPVRVPRGDVGRHHPAQLPAAGDPGAGPAGVSGRARPRLRGDHQLAPSSSPGPARATRPVTPSGSPASSTSTSRTCGEPRASSSSRSTPQGEVVGTVKTTPAVPGDNLVTNIDIGLQQVADNALASQILYVRDTPDPVGGRARPAPNGAVVVLDPQTGAVLAMSSYPYYNPNVWVGGISEANYQALQQTGPRTTTPSTASCRRDRRSS